MDECAVGNGGCPYANGVCHNTVGSYYCTCAPETSCQVVARCNASSDNPDTQSPSDNGCGGTFTCGDCCHTGSFCGGSTITQYRCACGNPGAGWVYQGGDCYHFATATPC